MSDEQLLEIMALADGELDGTRKAAVARWLADDSSAAALHRELSGIRTLVRAHEPAGAVPDSREFYWSQIQRRITTEERAAERKSPAKTSPLHWLRWLVPTLGLAAVALVIVVQQQPGASVIAGNGPSLTAGTDASAMTFTSDADGVTIRWIN